MNPKQFLSRALPAPIRRQLAWAARPLYSLPDQVRIALSPKVTFDGVRVYYGFPSLPNSKQFASGGIVKMQPLQPLFPNHQSNFNILYMVSSHAPYHAVQLARAARRKGVKVVWNQNGIGYPAWLPQGWEELNKRMAAVLHEADHVFYQSEYCRRSADHFLGVRHKSSEILYNAVDPSRFRPPESPLQDAPLILLLGGTQMRPHRLISALETLRVIHQTHPKTRLKIAGQMTWASPEMAQLEAQAMVRERSLEPYVEWIGFYSQEKAPSIYQQAHILLHTQYNDSCPSVVLEAMACGLPVVYSESGGTPELVGAEAGIGVKTAISWEKESVPSAESLAAAVLKVASDRKRYSEAARQRIENKFSLAAWVEKHKTVFTGLCRE